MWDMMYSSIILRVEVVVIVETLKPGRSMDSADDMAKRTTIRSKTIQAT